MANMSKTVADLKLDDEHMTIGIDDSMAEASRRLLTISGGILVVLDDDSKTKGVIGQRQFLKAFADNVDANETKCSEWMEMDFLEVQLSQTLKSVLADIRKRAPQAVVAIHEDGEFAGYFSPTDYQEATNLVSSLNDLNL
ncbi:MAG: CBS domain-containing protein [Euryarchaeota archaeon]|nr:CBS domain-containing protein [Euryarchaeota archaeon]MBT6641440.1 CBS domain-containing protein [Euryarchaeota archaeon]MBT6844398.1 CBS domain-containing protein [Euryarchaeota archaeon]